MLTWYRLENPRTHAAAEFEISADDVDGASFTISLVSMGGEVIAPEMRVFDDAMPTVMAFLFANGRKALAWEGTADAGFVAQLTNIGIGQA